jgi:hypothetical protein
VLTRTDPCALSTHSKCAAAAVWPLPCSLNFCMGPAPATSAWWALGAGAIIRAFPCSALVVSVAESWHSNPRPSSYLRRRCHKAARREQPAISERTGARLEPARPAPFPSPQESTRTAAARHLPPCPCPRACSARWALLHCAPVPCGALPLSPTRRRYARLPPLAFPLAMPLLGRARHRTAPQPGPSRSAQPAPVRPCALHLLSCARRPSAAQCMWMPLALCAFATCSFRVRTRFGVISNGRYMSCMCTMGRRASIACVHVCSAQKSACACVSMLYNVIFGNTCNT